ncbi:hypothetical protein [Hymenobacter perfusus]|uniref:Uncharacterized protein n=1 Tax=Hymenobacter perfusus TaxID=1236770 RepID=A0A3R9MFG4_9BACT|nr:hypothetical protein [Hymenobacter perfusus]RSK44672.1 hypothetical protein EI293_09180 [Hymenobacter perfusus]
MFRRPLLLLLLTSAAAPAALAQSSTPPSATPAAAAPAQYGIAYIYTLLGGGYELAFQDGVTPNPRLKRYEENGHDKVFVDEAAALNFLAAQGWEVLPYGAEDSNHYLLKRRAR